MEIRKTVGRYREPDPFRRLAELLKAMEKLQPAQRATTDQALTETPEKYGSWPPRKVVGRRRPR